MNKVIAWVLLISTIIGMLGVFTLFVTESTEIGLNILAGVFNVLVFIQSLQVINHKCK